MKPATTTPRKPLPVRVTLDQINRALERNDLDSAERYLGQFHEPLPSDLFEPMGLVHVMRGRWPQAAEVLGRVRDPSVSIRTLRRYAANLAALQIHHRHAFEAVTACPQSDRYQIDQPDVGLATILRVDVNGRTQPVVIGPTPQAHVACTFKAMTQSKKFNSCFGLGGIGDGNVLVQFLDRFPTDHLGIELPLFVIEPDPQLVAAVLMLHDLSDADGPIRSPRVQWCVGPEWQSQLKNILLDDPYTSPPSVMIQLTAQGQAVIPQVRRVCEALDATGKPAFMEMAQDYASRPAEQWAAILRGQAGRRPRVLLVTSRFTTVLQHSTRDVAEAFERLGWDTRLLIEPSAHQRLTTWCIQTVLTEFRPDLVFVIDYLRSGLPGDYPAALPFVGWIQDDLAHLMTCQAGRSIGKRDFVLTCAAKLYHEKFDYPLRQCIYAEKFTRVPDRPVSWACDGDDLVFVSNASTPPGQIVEQIVSEAGGGASAKELVRRCCDRVMSVYHAEAGGRTRVRAGTGNGSVGSGGAGGGCCIQAMPQVAKIVDEACREVGVVGLDPAVRTNLIMRLFNSLNNTLYRQQAIRWAVKVAQELGLTLALYGQGWEKNKEFARYAKGPVAYGKDLEELTRRAKINLQIVPFSCLHQRLLDGLVAGGFFLIRHHPLDDLRADLAAWLEDLEPYIRQIRDTKDLPLSRRDEIKRLTDAINAMTLDGDNDPIKTYRRHQEEGVEYLYNVLPRHDEVTFSDQKSLRAKVVSFLADSDRRVDVAEAQRGFVESTLTYESGLRRVLDRMARLIETQEG